jgi:ADP-ribose pyrophosphatase YjhB (NUDIX family)
MNSTTMYCNNCGGRGHIIKTCKDPITSYGIILIRGIFEPLKLPTDPNLISALMVRRKDSMAYMEFIRGKYNRDNKDYIKKLLSNMTIDEQKLISGEDFDKLWTKLWGQGRDNHSIEYEVAKENYEYTDRNELILQAPSCYEEPEWGFPKGRRSKGETDVECAVREFEEETNIHKDAYVVYNDITFTEVFKGTNDVSYKHVYFLACLHNSKLINLSQKLTQTQRREISAVSWKSLRECKQITRPHYTERKLLIGDVERLIQVFETLTEKQEDGY